MGSSRATPSTTPHMIPASFVNQMLLVGGRVEAPQALAWGLVSEVVAPDHVMPRAIELAEEIAGNAPLSVKVTESFIQAWRMAKMEDSYRLFEWAGPVITGSEDIKEGARAFSEKREPNWQGR